jgi:Tetracyclin repressor-like, C-terminal domain
MTFIPQPDRNRLKRVPARSREPASEVRAAMKYPSIHAALHQMFDNDLDDLFEAGLDRLISGLNPNVRARFRCVQCTILEPSAVQWSTDSSAATQFASAVLALPLSGWLRCKSA